MKSNLSAREINIYFIYLLLVLICSVWGISLLVFRNYNTNDVTTRSLVYRKAARNFGPVMATAAKFSVATVHEIVLVGTLDPETVITPGIHISKIVKIDHIATVGGGFKSA
jgi:hypothetical protein